MAFRSRQTKNYLVALAQSHLVSYPSPINLNYAWSFGSLAGIALVIQIITGVILAMHYVPNIDYAFNSVEHIMRNINHGWFFRYAHANGASMFFIVTYCHIFRGLYYGSYIHPRQLLWCSGVLIMLLMMGTAFIGYVLPWGQMSFWGATVITSMLTVIPVAGKAALEWFWGGFTVSNATLNRMYSLHFLLPFLIAGVVIVHLILLHKVGSNNPLGVDDVDVIPFYPYFFVKDLFALYVFLFFFAIIIFFYPNVLGHPDNYIPADPYKTPTHIVPEWYFLPFYAMLRSIPHKAGGIIAMLGSILVWLVIPFINTSEVRNTEYRPIYKFFFALVIIDFIFLGWLGQRGVYECHINFGQTGTFFYFLFFLVLSPVIGLLEKYLVRIKIEKH